MPVPAARRAREERGLVAVLVLLAASHQALGDLLPNELPGESSLTVKLRGAVGNYYRPGKPVLLRITVQNDGLAFDADVRVHETRSGGEAMFRGPSKIAIDKGANSVEILAAPAGGAAGTVLEVLRLPSGTEEGEGEEVGVPVFRGDLTRVLRALGSEDNLLVAVGVQAFPLPDGFVHVAVEPRDLPSLPLAYAAAHVVVLERVRREDVTSRQVEALAAWIRADGRAVFASFRALAPFSRAFFSEDRVVESPDRWREAVPHPWSGGGGTLTLPHLNVDLGLGRSLLYGVEPGDHSRWRGRKSGLDWPSTWGRRPAGDHWVDARAFTELAPDHPFRSSADRAKTVVLVAALVGCATVAVFIRKRKVIAAAVVGGCALAWATVAALVWSAPVGAARVVRVRAFTACGRAEVVTDTVVLAALGEDARVDVETSTGPAYPVGRREGELLGVPYELARRGDSWLISELRARGGAPTVVRSRLARGLDEEAESLRTRTLASGEHVSVEKLPGGRCRIEAQGEPPSPHIGYLLEGLARLARPGGQLAWLWIDGEPEGVRLLPEGRIDPAPGSGTLVIAAVPSTQGAHERPGADP
jgi:hypothetical protein